jgi:hypothetical protein
LCKMLPLLVVALVLFGGPASAAGPPRWRAAQINRLIKRLASDEFSERQTAISALEVIGESALPALVQATHDEDLEVRLRARSLLVWCILLLARCWGYPLLGRRGEAFPSAEARPLAPDWPLRVGPRACYILRL